MDPGEGGVLSIPRVLLSAAGIPTDGNLVIETVPGCHSDWNENPGADGLQAPDGGI